jgi:hypothetical protein
MEKTNPFPTQPEKSTEEPLLLSSLAVFWNLIEPLMTAAAPKRICEIGVGQGEFTALLLDFCARTDCRYSGIDFALSPELMHRLKAGHAEFFIEPSLKVLPQLPVHDVYFVDGDHNYFTVLNELRLILREHGRWPLVFLHDVGWPWGRRDQYCAPDDIPQEFRHPHSANLGAIPGRSELGRDGFSGGSSAYTYGAAEHEGGPRNGVLTAVEDFLGEEKRSEWKLLKIPAVFGLGILCAPEKCAPGVAVQFAKLETAIAPLENFFDLIERNRIALFLTYLRQVSEATHLHAQYNKLTQAYQELQNHSTGLQKNYGELLAHSDALLASYRDLETHTRAVQKAHDALLEKQ